MAVLDNVTYCCGVDGVEGLMNEALFELSNPVMRCTQGFEKSVLYCLTHDVIFFFFFFFFFLILYFHRFRTRVRKSENAHMKKKKKNARSKSRTRVKKKRAFFFSFFKRAFFFVFFKRAFFFSFFKRALENALKTRTRVRNLCIFPFERIFDHFFFIGGR